MTRLLAALLLLLCSLLPARAHDPKFSSLTLRLAATGLRGSLVIPAARWSPGDPKPALALEADGTPLRLELGPPARDPAEPRYLFEARAAWKTPPRALMIPRRLFADDPQSRMLLVAYEDERLVRETTLDASRPSLTHRLGADRPTLWETLTSFLRGGFQHIFGEPRQAFISDHVLFVLGLILLGGRLSQLLKIVTAFTLAHSITLAAAAVGLLAPSPRLIEPLIALSIVSIGVDNLLHRPEQRDIRAPLAFGFGLVHGFGFAGALREAGLPQEALAPALVAFNVGVELGQGLIVLAFAPGLAQLNQRAPKLGRPVLVGGSVAISLLGGWWFVQRILSL